MKRIALALTVGTALIGAALGANYVTASDHDDGTTDVKSQNVNLTDLYVFNEKSQNPSATGDNLIFIMNSNPRSVARQQYSFNTGARYEFHVSRVSSNDDVPTGANDVILRFEFGPQGADKKQNFTVSAIRDGQTLAAEASGTTTPLDAVPNNNSIKLGDQTLTVFAGLREDPFFFDVEQYFRVRDAAAKGAAGSVLFRKPGVDFTAGYNVLSIVARVPRAFLQGPTSATSFDVWETISVKK